MQFRFKLACITLGFAAAPLFGQQWPQFRGPNANPVGLDPKLPEKWSKTENVEWSKPIPGRGYSSPVVVGNRVFLTTVITDGASKVPQTGVDFSNDYAAELEKQGLPEAKIIELLKARDIEMPSEVKLHYFLYCLDLKTGSTVWKKEFYTGKPPGGRHRKNSFTSETPVSDGKSVFIYVGNLGLFAYDMDGNRKWSTILESYPIYLDFGTGSSPALHGNQLFIVNDNEKKQFIASIDKRDGRMLWLTERNFGDPKGMTRSGWVTPFIWTNSLRTEIVTIGPETAASYDLSGKELWRLSGMGMLPIPSPFVYEGLLYLDGGQTRPIWAIKPGASGDISPNAEGKASDFVAWTEPRAGTYLPTPVAYDGGLYVLTDKGILSRFDAKTGKTSYKSRLDLDAGAFTSSPWAYNGKIYCLNEEGKTFVVAAGETFKLLHTNALDEMAQATPAIVGDRLLLRTETRLYSIRR
jgi:outer membrane protein assembly factor BamB